MTKPLIVTKPATDLAAGDRIRIAGQPGWWDVTEQPSVSADMVQAWVQSTTTPDHERVTHLHPAEPVDYLRPLTVAELHRRAAVSA